MDMSAECFYSLVPRYPLDRQACNVEVVVALIHVVARPGRRHRRVGLGAAVVQVEVEVPETGRRRRRSPGCRTRSR